MSRLRVIWGCALFAAALSVLYPPWLIAGPRLSAGGYGFLLTGPALGYVSYRLDIERLFVQLTAIILLAGVVHLAVASGIPAACLIRMRLLRRTPLLLVAALILVVACGVLIWSNTQSVKADDAVDAALREQYQRKLSEKQLDDLIGAQYDQKTASGTSDAEDPVAKAFRDRDAQRAAQPAPPK